jgi:DNA-binding HxlR family transcriptional regulator
MRQATLEFLGMPMRTYGQYCGVARSLELVGERWALLIVRDLILGPRRFTDLQRGLGTIPSNVLSSRLKELEESGVIKRRALPRPDRGVVYELTEYGRELEPIVVDLLLWGMRSLGDPRPEDNFSANSFLLGLRVAFQSRAARGLDATYEIRIEDSVFTVRVAKGKLALADGPADAPDLTIETDLGLGALLQGEITAAEARKRKVVRLRGDAALLDRFAATFRLPTAANA